MAETLWGDRSRREQAKAISHGWNYGAGVSTIMRASGLPEDVIRDFDQRMRQQFPTLVQWREDVYRRGERGEVLDNGFGRRLKVDPKHAYTQGAAYLGQSTARDLLAAGILRLPLDVVRMIRAVVHDEIVLSVPDDRLDEVTAIVLASMEFNASEVLDYADDALDVRITCGATKPGKNWGSVYTK
jgi:DNA polymerase-1